MKAPTTSPTPPTSPRTLWGLLAIFVACYVGLVVSHPDLLRWVGVNHYGVWFLDSFAILASNDALARGLDPYAVNPLDYFNRPHVYSHWWLRLRDLGLTRADNFVVGLTLVIAFVAVAVARLRPREPRELLWYLVVLCSSPVVLAVERANNDLVIFLLLAPVVPCLLASRRAVRWLAIFLIAAAAGLKFYPAIAALVLLAPAEAKEVRLRLAVMAAALAVVGLGLVRDLAGFSAIAPKAEGLMTFGAANLFEALGLAGRAAKSAGLAVGAAVAVGFWRTKIFAGWEIRAEDRNAWLSFTLGAVLLTGCFFAGTNFAYRWVFALWLAPLLWRVPRDAAAPAVVRRLAAAVAVLLAVALWLDALVSAGLTRFAGKVPPDTLVQWADRIFLVEQPLTWALFAGLIGFLVHFARTGLRGIGPRFTQDLK
ncbi:MAG: hypothetical protein RLZZ15_3726 [Verrucomicrobiota bacterium]